jgi:formate hydrogenlyase transcriptional activator
VDDIPLLVEYLIERYASNAGKKIRYIKKRTLELFRSYDWPGNIRELQNVVQRAVICCDDGAFSIDETWLKNYANTSPVPSISHAADPASTERELVSSDREMIEAALQESHGRISGPSGAATRLGIPRQTLDSKIRSLRINKHRFKTA